MLRVAAVAAVLATLTAARPAVAQILNGSPTSLDRQFRAAERNNFTYLQTRSQVKKFLRLDLLVSLPGNADYRTHNVTYPYARPEVRLFVERLANQYRAACGRQLVVTSLTRPKSFNRTLWNSSDHSVHMTGMAVDLRVSSSYECRQWLRSVLASLERANVLEATREYNPPHFHVALFCNRYTGYVARIDGPDAVDLVTDAEAYVVSGGDSLWGIAQRNGISVRQLKAANDLSSTLITPGQVLKIPEPADGAEAADPAPAADAYVVSDGDTLWGIARRTDTSVRRIKAVNNLHSTRIQPGQVLKIPTG